MLTVVICKDFGWTLYEYLNHPYWFIDQIKEMYRIDAQKAERTRDKTKKK